MKKLIALLTICISISGFAQKSKPDYSKLPSLNMVSAYIKGTDLQNNIWQDSIAKVSTLSLRGTDSENFEIIYYKFKTNYKNSLTTDEFYQGNFPDTMIQFFKDLEKNCRVSFENIVVKHKENGKMFKIGTLSVLIKI